MSQDKSKNEELLAVFTPERHVWVEGCDLNLDLSGTKPFSAAITFYCDPRTEPPPLGGHQRGPAKWHEDKILLSKYNGNCCGSFRIGLNKRQQLLFERGKDTESPLLSKQKLEDHAWHTVVCTYDGRYMAIYINGRSSARCRGESQAEDAEAPLLIGADLLSYGR